jgi:hypothetical protein
MKSLVAYILAHPALIALALSFTVSELQALLPDVKSNGIFHYLILKVIDAINAYQHSRQN